MIPVYYDYETYWSQTHSLTKLNPIEYIMHPDTELQSVSIAIGDDDPVTYLGPGDVACAMMAIDWSDKMAVAHNGSGFDHLISSWRLGIKPKAWACTLAMSRPFFGLTVGGSLKALSKELGLPDKGSLELVNTKGLRFSDFTPQMKQAMIEYNDRDTINCREIFKRLMPRLGMHEMKLIDTVIRMSTDLRFMADFDVLEAGLKEEREKKRQALLKLATHCIPQTSITGLTTEDQLLQAMRSIVMSQPQFAQLLVQLGAEVPMKESKTVAGKMIPALAKTDEGMTALLDYDSGDEDNDMKVRVAAAARLEVKTTQLETRLQTYINVANACGGYLPAPINYCGGTISWRMSGGMKMNMQNNPRIDKRNPKTSDALRYGIVAPPGYKVVVADSSNIELRVAHCLAGQEDTVAKLRKKEDLYCWFASTLYGRQVTKADELERFIGKVAMLSLQYGSSWRTFQNMARVLSKGKVMLDEATCRDIVIKWRGMFPMISGWDDGMWGRCDKAISAMYHERTIYVDRQGLVQTDHNSLITPQNHWLQYPGLHVENSSGKNEWWYGQGQHRSRLYGAHLFENICQHLARIIVMEQTLAAGKRYPVALTCHDEVVFVAPEDEAEACRDYALECMSKSPDWWPDLPVAAEAGIGQSYGAAK